MKKYIGTKEIMAEPMKRLDAIRNGFTRSEQLEYEDGYHVVYKNPDGTTYDSWSPADMFELAYQPAETPLDRMRIEHHELELRLQKLVSFLDRGYDVVEEHCGSVQTTLMIHQKYAMSTYLSVLSERIRDLEAKEEKKEEE